MNIIELLENYYEDREMLNEVFRIFGKSEERKNREEIIKKAQIFKSYFNKFNPIFNHKESEKFFIKGNNNYYMFCEYSEMNNTWAKEIKKVIEKINRKCEDYYFKLKYRSVWVYVSSNMKKFLTKEDYNKVVTIAKKILNKYTTLKPAFKFTSYKVDEDNPYMIEFIHYDTWNIKWSEPDSRSIKEYNEIFQNPFESYCNDLKLELKNKYRFSLEVDGDEDTGTIYFKKKGV